MATRVLLTVDTELVWRHYTRGASWREVWQRSFDPAGVGVPFQLKLLAEHDLKACFFVDPMPALVYGLTAVKRMVEPILAAGQEVQLHIHPFWKGLAESGVAENFELTCFEADAQRDLIAKARELLMEAGAPEPIAFRSGSYAADARTLEALRGLGIRYDSSHNGGHHPVPSALPFDPRLIAPIEAGGVVEVPVTVIEDRPGRVRHLQLTAVSFDEFRAALLHAVLWRHPIVTVVSHSFELASRDGLRPNLTLCRRFERLCAFLAEHGDVLPTVHFTELDDLPLGAEAEPLPPRKLRRVSRMAEQMFSNIAYEWRL